MALEARRSRTARGDTSRRRELTPDEEFVVRSSVSERRKQEFHDSYLEDRREVRTIEMLFKRVGAFHLSNTLPPKDVEASGFKVLLHKGPFVEGSNWLQDSPRSFATEMERHLAMRLDSALQEAVQPLFRELVQPDARAIVETLELLDDELGSRGFRTTLVIISGDVGSRLRRHLDAGPTSQLVPEWDSHVRSALETTYRMLGMWRDVAFRDVPVLTLPESRESLLYTVDLARFAALTRYEQPGDFVMVEFDEEEARKLLERQPGLVTDPPPGTGSDEDRINRLRLRVGLDLWETYELSVKDPRAVIAHPLATS